MRILVLCTGNACRSQMAEGWARVLAARGEFFSAGTEPAERVNPRAVQVMAEKGIDISGHYPKLLSDNSLENIEPLPRDEHIRRHIENGDFERWGATRYE